MLKILKGEDWNATNDILKISEGECQRGKLKHWSIHLQAYHLPVVRSQQNLSTVSPRIENVQCKHQKKREILQKVFKKEIVSNCIDNSPYNKKICNFWRAT